MIYIIERHVEDYLHVLANVNTIKILKQAFPFEKISFFSAQKHNIKVREYFNQNDEIVFKPFKNRIVRSSTISKAIGYILKMASDLMFFFKLFLKSTNHDVLVISHIYPHSLLVIKLLKLFFRETKVLVLLHGEVEYVFFYRSILEKLIGKIYRLVFKIPAINFQYVFLTSAARNILSKSKLLKSDEFIAIELPTFRDVGSNSRVEVDFSAIKIAHIGSAGKRKNVDKIFELSNLLAPEITTKEIDLSLIGVLEESIKPYLNHLVRNFVNDKTNHPLSRGTFDNEIAQINYAIFFYLNNDFLLRSSAAYFDSVYYEKPIIALNCHFFENLFNEHGEMGYLCKNIQEMSALIKWLTKNPEQRKQNYTLFIENIRKYKNKLQLSNIAKDFKCQAKSLNI